MRTRFDYAGQARTYDRTRAASPSVLRPVRAALAAAPGRRLLDIGGGTGNYAAALCHEGWEPVVVDVSAEMLAWAREKGLQTARGDAQALPFAGASFDAATAISMLHHVPDFRAALAEARRVLVPEGRLVVMGWTREHIEQVTWVTDYFPSTRAWLDGVHESLPDLLDELPGARVIPVLFDDTVDLNLATLQRHPRLLLRPDLRAQTSYFERLAARDPDELASGLARLEKDLAAGIDPRQRVVAARERLGDACVLVWKGVS